MREIGFLDRLAENLLEGGFIRALKPRLQPVQMARALAREMGRSRMIGPEAPYVANHYRVYVSPADFAQISRFQSNLERELAGYLRGYASRRGYRPIGAISVNLLQSSHLKTGQIKTEGEMVDSAPPEPTPWPEAEIEVEHSTGLGTMEMPAVDPIRPAGTGRALVPDQPRAALLAPDGAMIRIVRPVTSIGRAVDNDVVLDARSVSRRHAQIRWDGDGYVLEDLGSTNGTSASGRRITHHRLSDGEEVSFGGLSFVFRQAPP